jgi:hypothetical protein
MRLLLQAHRHPEPAVHEAADPHDIRQPAGHGMFSEAGDPSFLSAGEIAVLHDALHLHALAMSICL